MSPEDREHVVRGIAAYHKEQALLLRLLRFKGGSFTERDFDRWLKPFRRVGGKTVRRRTRLRFWPVTGDSFILGLGVNGFNDWARMLDLLQKMVAIDLVHAKKRDDGLVEYALPEAV